VKVLIKEPDPDCQRKLRSALLSKATDSKHISKKWAFQLTFLGFCGVTSLVTKSDSTTLAFGTDAFGSIHCLGLGPPFTVH